MFRRKKKESTVLDKEKEKIEKNEQERKAVADLGYIGYREVDNKNKKDNANVLLTKGKKEVNDGGADLATAAGVGGFLTGVGGIIGLIAGGLGVMTAGAAGSIGVGASVLIGLTIGAACLPVSLAIAAGGIAYAAVGALRNNKEYNKLLKPTKDIDMFFQALTKRLDPKNTADIVYEGSYELKNNDYTFYNSPETGKEKFTVLNGIQGIFYVYNTKTKEPIFKWVNEGGKQVIFYHWNAIIFIASTENDQFISHKFDQNKKKFETKLSSRKYNKEGTIYKQLSVKCPPIFFTKEFNNESNKMEIIMKTAVQAFQKAGKGAAKTKFGKYAKKRIKINRNRKKQIADKKAELLPVKKSNPVYDPFPFATQIRRREHNLYKKLRY